MLPTLKRVAAPLLALLVAAPLAAQEANRNVPFGPQGPRMSQPEQAANGRLPRACVRGSSDPNLYQEDTHEEVSQQPPFGSLIPRGSRIAILAFDRPCASPRRGGPG